MDTGFAWQHSTLVSYSWSLYMEIEDYWCKKRLLTDDHFSDIDWEANRRVAHQSPIGKHHWLIKFTSGHCTVGRMECWRKHQDHDKCPCCLGDNKTTTHVLVCPDSWATTQWTTKMGNIRVWMMRHYTHLDVMELVICLLRNWHDYGWNPANTSTPQSLRPLLRAQTSIGVHNFLLGRVSSLFTDIQNSYLWTQDTKLTGWSWTARLIVQLWNIAWNMWDHCNHIKHNPDHPWHVLTKCANLQLISHQYKMGSKSLLPKDQGLLATMIEQFQSHTNVQLEQWLESICLARQAFWQHQDKMPQQTASKWSLLLQWRTQAI